MTLADRMAVFMEGEIQQIGRPADIFARPNSVDVAGFIGSPPMNLLPGRIEGGQVVVAGKPLASAPAGFAARDVIVGVRPGAVQVNGTGRAATVEFVENLGDTAILDLKLDGAPIRARISDGRPFADGDNVAITVAPQDIHLFDAETRRRIGV